MKGIVAPEIGPKSFSAFEKQARGDTFAFRQEHLHFSFGMQANKDSFLSYWRP